MKNLNLAAPWVRYYNELVELFGQDDEINVIFDEDNKTIKLYVNNSEKAEALSELLPSEKDFGAIVVKISVVPANVASESKFSLFRKAFEGNPVVSYTKSVENPMAFPANFIVFVNKVVQYQSDDLGDINGLTSTLYQEIAKDVFEDHDGIYFCTDRP